MPNKNIKELCGKPLITCSIEAALESGYFQEVMVSTDSEEYAKIARKEGAPVPPLRSNVTLNDIVSSWDRVDEVLNRYRELGREFDTFCLLQPTSPLRTAEDIVASCKLYEEHASFAVVAVRESEHSLLWCRQIPNNTELARFIDQVNMKKWQLAGKYYHINIAIYIINFERYKKNRFLYQDGNFACIMPRPRSVDIDTIIDFKITEIIWGGDVWTNKVLLQFASSNFFESVCTFEKEACIA